MENQRLWLWPLHFNNQKIVEKINLLFTILDPKKCEKKIQFVIHNSTPKNSENTNSRVPGSNFNPQSCK
jgi:hypothetical protein